MEHREIRRVVESSLESTLVKRSRSSSEKWTIPSNLSTFPLVFHSGRTEVAINDAFKNGKKWRGYADYLTARVKSLPKQVPQGQSGSVSFYEIQHIPLEEQTRYFLTDKIEIVKVLKCSYLFNLCLTSVCVVKIHGENDATKECVAKFNAVIVASDEDDDNYFKTREYVSGGKDKVLFLRLISAWIEPIAFSKVYAHLTYGCHTLFSVKEKRWYTLLLCPLYSGTMWNILSDGLDQSQIKESYRKRLVSIARDHLFQIIFFTLPFAKRCDLVAHNDAKTDNIVWEPTTRKYLYVQITGTSLGVVTLAIPTEQRLFKLIDFGWCSIFCVSENLLLGSCSPPYYLDEHMKVWNFTTDFAQVAYHFLHALQSEYGTDFTGLFSAAKGDWADFVRTLSLLACTDDRCSIMEVNGENWVKIFYSAISYRCHGQRIEKLVEMASQLYAIDPKKIPHNRTVLKYDMSLFGCTRQI